MGFNIAICLKFYGKFIYINFLCCEKKGNVELLLLIVVMDNGSVSNTIRVVESTNQNA